MDGLTKEELRLCRLASVMTCELAMRATDYIDGDLYFKVSFAPQPGLRPRAIACLGYQSNTARSVEGMIS